jgi:ABC-type polysaccharide/polyol phosphate transport system ATPase subunit
MKNIVIKAENISKQYRLGQVGTGTLGHDLNRMWSRFRGQEDPYLKIGDVNDRTAKGGSDYVWSLRNINFEIEQGEAVGIIGRNGAGKSTLLKLLSKVTKPTTGSFKVQGRIASLLEVGTGFNPEMTGRENIYLNGAILGMRRQEITRKFDEIVDFSGVDRYIDTPVKRYSSGMYVRLAFAVAAHLESEILIVDEVLAVGDAEFQKKCLGKMGDVTDKEGRTVLFVSHNMAAVKELCNSSIFLKNGEIYKTGDTKDIIRDYLLNPLSITSEKDLLHDSLSRRGNGEIRFTSIIINNNDVFLDPQKDVTIRMTARVNKPIEDLYFSMIVKGPENSEPITNTGLIEICNKRVDVGVEITFSVTIPANTFRTGLFPIYFWLGRPLKMAVDNYVYDVIDSVYYFNFTSDKSRELLGYNSMHPAGYFNISKTIHDIQIS